VPHCKASSPIFCYVTDRAGLRSSELREPATQHRNATPPHEDALHESASHGDTLAPLLACIASAAAAGVHWIQLREKDLAARDLAHLTRAAMTRCSPVNRGATNSSPSPPRIFVNDRLDVAIAERAGGIHLSENSLAVSDVRRLLRTFTNERHLAEFLVGVSCHSLASAQAAAAAGADYIFFGPIFPTPSKRVYGHAKGLQSLVEVCRAVNIPVLAIGGINAENAAVCLDSGASGIAAIRMFQQPHELPAVAGLLRSLTK
jgi:thiamine-phosphate pyrophosphorylase